MYEVKSATGSRGIRDINYGVFLCKGVNHTVYVSKEETSCFHKTLLNRNVIHESICRVSAKYEYMHDFNAANF